MKLSKQMIRRLVMQEMARMVDEDKIIPHSDAHRKFDMQGSQRSQVGVPSAIASDYGGGKVGTCEQCGGMSYEGSCLECDTCGCSEGNCDEEDYSMMEEGMMAMGKGDYGCGTIDDGSDYSIDSMMTPLYGMGATSMHIDFPHHGEVHKHKHNNYMAKPALYKVAKYAHKLLQMIPDGYELDDWQRTKIAQISDDISEVYHSLDYDFYDDEC